MKRRLSLEAKSNIAGYLFLLPWILGAIKFFVIPFAKSALYAFSKVSLNEAGLHLDFVGWENFDYMLLRNSDYIEKVTNSVTTLLKDVPLIWFFSMFIAIVINQKFIGRTFMRAVFFLPVIVGTGMVLRIINQDVFVANGMAENSQIFQATALADMLNNLHLGEGVTDFIVSATSQVFDLSWKSGLQILLYLSSIQTIPTTYYEVASIEGANAWDTFWKITFPVLAPTSLLVVIYTIIDTFTNSNNAVMREILDRIDNFLYGYASAAAMIFFVVISIILLLVFLVARKAVASSNDY